MNLDILIPVYQPHSNWAIELVKQFETLKSRLPSTFNCTMIIVNDGSLRSLEDEVKVVLDAYPSTVWISYASNRGKGYALRRAAEFSTADLIMYTDYDFPYTYGSMVKMIDQLSDPLVDAVVGKRDDSYYNHISQRRRAISQFLKKVNKILFRLPTEDTQCGLKAFRASQKALFLSTKTDRYLIDVEFLKLLSRAGSKVAVQMVKLRKGVVLSKISNLSLIKELINYFRIMAS